MVNPETNNNHQEVSSTYKAYKGELEGYISKRVRLKEDVEDILQNVFYNLAKIDQEINPIEQISSWLYTVAQNQITDYYRKKKDDHLSDYGEDEDDTFLENVVSFLSDDSSSDPETIYLQSLVWIELEAALNELPQEQRSVFELNELEGISFKEISQSTGIPTNTLLSRKRYAVLYLREKLYHLYDELVKTK